TRPMAQPAERRQDAIAIRDLVFGYVPDRPVLRGVSFNVQAGGNWGVVGGDGGGEGGMVGLVWGVVAARSGAGRLAGRGPRALSDEERRRAVAVVPQLVQLFSGTVRDNLTLGDESVPDEIVAHAAAIAGAAAFVQALPQGYDTVLSGSGRSGGTQLSAGPPPVRGPARA